jgi:hypothetical protein
MLVVFYSAHIAYICVRVTCCTSYCLCDKLIDPLECMRVRMYVRVYMHVCMHVCLHYAYVYI